MRLHVLLSSLAIVLAAGCGQSTSEPQSPSAQTEVLPDAPVETAVEAQRTLSVELPSDDPAFRAATDAYDPDELERRMKVVTGLSSNDLGTGYFGQQFFTSLWAPVSDDVAMNACHALVAYVNEIDFPATAIVVRQKTYDDLQWSQELVAVDASGSCAALPA